MVDDDIGVFDTSDFYSCEYLLTDEQRKLLYAMPD